MRILVVTDLFPPDVVGGYELRCEEVCNWLYRNGHEIEVLTSISEYSGFVHNFKIHRILRKYPYGATPHEWNSLKRFYLTIWDNYLYKKTLNSFKPDCLYIWHCLGISRSLIPELFNSRIPTVVDVSDKWLNKVSREWGPIYGLLTRRSSSFIKIQMKHILLKLLPVISFNLLKSHYNLNLKKVKGYFTSHWNKEFHLKNHIECEHFEAFHTGINLEKFPFKGKKNRCDPITLLYVGMVSKGKGFLLLLEQLEYLSYECDWPIKFIVVGRYINEKFEQVVKKKIKTFRKNYNFIYYGHNVHSDMYKFYHQANFTVFPSLLDEAFSRIPLESMACGTPCISTDNLGSKELFAVEAPLLLLDRQDNRSLWNSIQKYYRSPEKYVQLSLSGRQFVEKFFTFDCFMWKVEKLINSYL